MGDASFNDHRRAAMALLTKGINLREKEGNFLGGLAFRVDPLSERQANWLQILLERHQLPPLEMGGGNG
ncbi:hypothetical protein [Sphingomonas adhaesiva]|uniref:hypothetical protein n=1 Tax=Sphingomonas adhaesiva TaxID=28212 RepID=UPI002FF9C1B8